MYRMLEKAIKEPKTIKTKVDLIGLTTDLKLSGLRNTSSTANEAIKRVYGVENKKLNTFIGWKNEGKKIKKGAEAYTFWSGKKSFTVEKDGEDKEYKFFNICKLFSEDDTE